MVPKNCWKTTECLKKEKRKGDWTNVWSFLLYLQLVRLLCLLLITCVTARDHLPNALPPGINVRHLYPIRLLAAQRLGLAAVQLAAMGSQNTRNYL